MIVMSNNPSRCLRFYVPLQLSSMYLCDCADGYYGKDYCMPLSDNIEMPPFTTYLGGVHIPSNRVQSATSVGFALGNGDPNVPQLVTLQLELASSNDTNPSSPSSPPEPLPIREAYSVFFNGTILSADLTVMSSLFAPVVGNLQLPLQNYNLLVPRNFTYSTNTSLPDGIQLAPLTGKLSGSSNASGMMRFDVIVTEQFCGETAVVAKVNLSIVDCGSYTCLNGGTCQDASGSVYDNVFTCHCTSGFTGGRCEALYVAGSSSSSSSSNPAAVAGIVVSLLFVFVVVGSVMFIKVRAQRLRELQQKDYHIFIRYDFFFTNKQLNLKISSLPCIIFLFICLPVF